MLVRVLAPILSFTCEEVWDFMPETLRDAESVHLSDWPVVHMPHDADQLTAAYAIVVETRELVNAALEEARAGKTIGKSQEAAVLVSAPARRCSRPASAR